MRYYLCILVHKVFKFVFCFMLLGAYVLDEVVRNIVEALRSACREFNEDLYPLAISNADFASKAAVILLCDYAFKRNLIGKPSMSHRVGSML